MSRKFTFVLLGLMVVTAAQQIGQTPEIHPKLTTRKCTKRGGCITQQTSVVLDALSHPIHDIYTGSSCENSTSGGLNTTICPTPEACARNCELKGVNYANHGVYTQGDSITLRQYLDINGTETSVSPRVYLLDPSGKDYDNVQLLNQELSFTVDVSNLPCGENGALYLSAMDLNGGRSALNPAGATYGTGE
jgi:cellulase